MNRKLPAAIKRKLSEIRSVVTSWNGPIVVAYSGGKDSSAVIKLVCATLVRFPRMRRDLKIIYCDTGVENPIVSAFVKSTLCKLSNELEEVGIHDSVHILRPAINQRYFVRIVGRGYPPPTQFFRWCTKDLRIRPVQTFIRGLDGKSLVIVGTRTGESAQRDRILRRASNQRGPFIQKQGDGGSRAYLYSPIVEFTLEDVWETLLELRFPVSIDIDRLVSIYRDGGGECPIVREANDKPCSSARFGCWTCTVVRRDRSAEKLIEAGYSELVAYHEFRQWLSDIRNDPQMRCSRRRNGKDGLGPFNLAARSLILERVRRLERRLDTSILDTDEIREIYRLWNLDRHSEKYAELEPTMITAAGTKPSRKC